MAKRVLGAQGTHPGIAITQDETHRLVTDEQITRWDEGIIGKATIMSLVFRRTSTVPDTPTGGSFNTPIPDGGLWSNVPMYTIEPLFISTRLFTNDGELPQQDVWSPPSLFVTHGDSGITGPKGDDGATGIQGSPGRDGTDGVHGDDGTSIAWVGEASTHPINPSDGNSYYNTTTKKSYVYWDGAWYQMSIDGFDGVAGISQTVISIFQTSTDNVNPPSDPTGYFTYNFGDGTFIEGGTSGAGDFNNWSTALPTAAKGEYVWVIQASASSDQGTDDIAANEFSGAVVLSGVGIDGLNNTTVNLYYKSSDGVNAPALPSGDFTYTFSTALLTGGTLNGWSQSCPEIDTGEYIWLIQATASSNVDTDIIPIAEFSAPVVFSANGNNGLSVVWKGEFTDPPENPETNWAYRDTDNGLVYIYDGAAWELMIQDGTDGAEGAAGQGQVKGVSFLRAATQPTTPTGGTFTAPNATGWSDGVPADNGNAVWMVTRIFTSDGLSPQQSVWTTPQVIGATGTDGNIGDGINVQFSVDGVSSWHDTPAVNDMYMRKGTNVNGGAYTYAGAILIKGEEGTNGLSVYITYHDNPANVTPTAPTVPAGNNNGWHTGATDLVFWMSQKVDDGTGSDWSDPILIRGEDGYQGEDGESGFRGSGIFTIDAGDANTPYITYTTASIWANTLTTAEAINVARDIIGVPSGNGLAVDGYLRPNDKITITDTSSQVAGTRVYTSAETNNPTSVVAGDFSDLITETVDGNLIITGTVSVDKLSSDIVSAGTINTSLLTGAVIQTNYNNNFSKIIMSGNTLKVYDENGIVRVELGEIL